MPQLIKHLNISKSPRTDNIKASYGATCNKQQAAAHYKSTLKHHIKVVLPNAIWFLHSALCKIIHCHQMPGLFSV